MADEQREETEIVEEEKKEEKSSQNSLFSGIYDQLPDISVRSLDRFILACVIALVLVILIGTLRAHHIL